MKPKDREEAAFYVALGRLLLNTSAKDVAEMGWRLLHLNRLRLNAANGERSNARDRYSALLYDAVRGSSPPNRGLRLLYKTNETLPWLSKAVIVFPTGEELSIPWT